MRYLAFLMLFCGQAFAEVNYENVPSLSVNITVNSEAEVESSKAVCEQKLATEAQRLKALGLTIIATSPCELDLYQRVSGNIYFLK